jgi:hypothetical protein
VRARDHARIWIDGDVHADAYDSAVVVAKGRCRVRAADRVRVYAQNGVVVTCQGPAVSIRRAWTPGGTAVSARPARHPASPTGPASTHPADAGEAQPQ